MRVIGVIVFLSCLFAKDTYQLSWQVFFRLNQQELAASNCENLDKPALKCNGKCYLAKQLKKAETQAQDETASPIPPNAPKLDLHANAVQFSFVWSPCFFTPTVSNFAYVQCDSNGYSGQIEHPPCV